MLREGVYTGLKSGVNEKVGLSDKEPVFWDKAQTCLRTPKGHTTGGYFAEGAARCSRHGRRSAPSLPVLGDSTDRLQYFQDENGLCSRSTVRPEAGRHNAMKGFTIWDIRFTRRGWQNGRVGLRRPRG
jgi:hypothetical protein